MHWAWGKPKSRRRRAFSVPQLAARFILIYGALVTVMFVSVIGANLIPNDAIEQNLRRSLPEQNYALVFGSTPVDQFTECIVATIGLGSKAEERGLVKRSLFSPMLGSCEQSWRFFKTGVNEGKNYWEYWHGSQIISRPALAFMSVLDLRLLTLFLFVLSFMIAFQTLWRHNLEIPALALLASLFCVHLQSALFVLPHAADWIIGFLACGFVVTALGREPQRPAETVATTLFLAGMLSAFFGLLNNPLVSLTIPLFGLFWSVALRPKRRRATTSMTLTAMAASAWFAGYAACWAAKWLLVRVFRDDAFTYIVDLVGYRLGGAFRGTEALKAADITVFNSVHMALRENRTAIIVVAACALLSVPPLVQLAKRLKPAWPDVMSFLLICALPIAWFAVLRNHTIRHAWFVSAGLYGSFAMVLAVIGLSWRAALVSRFSSARARRSSVR